ncbi:hypothetical protein APB12_38180 [Pseudomonas aeruginosa]|nr:hypothetical protein APB12_38180 [Pseudomonas aeruginosa]
MKSVIVPSVQSPPSMLKLHDFCNRAEGRITGASDAPKSKGHAQIPVRWKTLNKRADQPIAMAILRSCKESASS